MQYDHSFVRTRFDSELRAKPSARSSRGGRIRRSARSNPKSDRRFQSSAPLKGIRPCITPASSNRSGHALRFPSWCCCSRPAPGAVLGSIYLTLHDGRHGAADQHSGVAYAGRGDPHHGPRRHGDGEPNVVGWCIGAILGIAIAFGAPQIVTWVRGMFGSRGRHAVMHELNAGLATDPLFVGATRPPMRWASPIRRSFSTWYSRWRRSW